MSTAGIITGRRWSNGRPIVKVTIGVLAASVVTFTMFTDAAPVVRPVTHVSHVLPCVEEDSAGPCFWDASTRGNGAGVSFTVDADQVVHYATEATR